MHAARRTAVDDDDARPCRIVASDDASRHEVKLRLRLLVAEKRLEACIFSERFVRFEILHAQPLHLVLQHTILVVDVIDFPKLRTKAVDLVSHPGRHGLEGTQHRRGGAAQERGLKPALSCKEHEAEDADERNEEQPDLAVRVLVVSAYAAHCLNFLEIITTRFRSSMFSSDLPVPSPTQDKGSSAMRTGMPVSWLSSLSRFVKSAPPPVIMMP